MIEVKCMGPVCVVERPEKLTGGMVGKKIRFTFDGVWDGLTRQAVLWTERCRRVMTLPLDNTAEIPAELLAVPARMLWVGVRGYDADMTLVIPTDWGELGEIVPGTEAAPGGEAPTPTQAQQLQAEIDAAAGKAQRAEDTAAEAFQRVEAADGAAARAETAAAQAQTAADGVHDVGRQVEQQAADARTAACNAQEAASASGTSASAAVSNARQALKARESAEGFSGEARQQADRAKAEADRAAQLGGAQTAAELAAIVPPGLHAEPNVQSTLNALAGLMTEVDGLIGGGIRG